MLSSIFLTILNPTNKQRDYKVENLIFLVLLVLISEYGRYVYCYGLIHRFFLGTRVSTSGNSKECF